MSSASTTSALTAPVTAWRMLSSTSCALNDPDIAGTCACIAVTTKGWAGMGVVDRRNGGKGKILEKRCLKLSVSPSSSSFGCSMTHTWNAMST